jgi:hypothetical protein
VTHLGPSEFVDAAEGTLDSRRLQHVETCASCRHELDTLKSVMREAGQGPISEPSPLFWDHFSARVRQAIAVETARAEASWWPRTWRWQAAAPLGALAVLVLLIVASITWRTASVPEAGFTAERLGVDLAVPEPTSDETAWHALAEMVGPLDWDVAGEAGLTLLPGDADLALLDLSDDERAELSRLVTRELSRAKS